MNFLRILGATLVASLFAFAVAARADTSIGTLVYDFTYSANQNVTARDDANSSESVTQAIGGPKNGGCLGGPTCVGVNYGSGMSHYAGSLTDKGTMIVNVIKKQPDGALVVMVSEQGENIRRASPAECVVYGNTNVICDPNKTVYTEEYTLLRFLAQNFVDPSELGADKHWKIVQDVNNDHVTANYTINGNNNGQMRIGEARTITEIGPGHLTTDVTSQIGYDYTRTVPTSINEYAQQYTDAGLKGSQRSIYQTTLELVSDTMAKS